jgi:threo-3-hydroxy-L-aspartate ammonia-lyase
VTVAPRSAPSASSSGDPLVSIDDIRAAAATLAGITVRTPLLPFGRPIEGHPKGHPRVWLKPELLQPIGAFKLRGAFNAMASLSAVERARGVVTHSSGNHAQGVARAARILGIRAVVVMPSDAPAIKVAGVRADGAEVVTVGTSSDERVRVSEALARDQGLVLIPAYDDARIIAGQGTCGLEIVEQLAELGYGSTPFTVLVPIGGGGLASGVAVAVKTLRPDARVFGVEPEVAADAAESLRTGRVVRWDAEQVGRTAADGMRTSALGALTFRHLSALADGVLTVSEIGIRRAMVRAARQARLVVEPSGATSLAAWLAHEAELPADGPVVAILSGGNADAERYAELMAEGLAAGG